VEKITCAKLSRLQKLILVALTEPRYALMTRREFRRAIKRLYWGKDNRVTIASLSQSLARLEERRYILRSQGRWQLTDSSHNLGDNGMLLAVLAWGQARELYTMLGLKGPSAEALGIKRSVKDGPGVVVNFDFPEEGKIVGS
jgi:hypothetical protein